MTNLTRLLLCVVALFGIGAISAEAQTYRAGQAIEYRRTGATEWEPGTIIGPTADGRQYLVRRKPSQFFPQGSEAAFFPNELRLPQGAQAPAPQPRAQPQPQPPAQPRAAPAGPAAGACPPGQAIEYSRTGADWELGTIIGPTADGRQCLVRRKPSQFFPEGAEAAFFPNELRPPQGPQPPAPQPAPPQPRAGPPADIAQRPIVPPRAPPGPAACPAGGPMNEEAVLAYARQVLGPNPWGPDRERGVAQIRDCIKQNGATFVSSQAFDNRMHAQGTNAVHINYAIDDNYNRHPTLNDYFGTFDLRSAVTGRLDTQKRLGGLAIDPNGTYVWDVLGDGRNIIRGTWRQATPADMKEYEGGPGIVLQRARDGFDYHVRVNRTPGREAETWIEVGLGRGRQSVQYGRKL
jgi:hypothetical protein